MTVQELIDKLNAIDDKSKDVSISIDVGDGTHPMRKAYAEEITDVIVNDLSDITILCEGHTNYGSDNWDFEVKY